MNEKLMGHSVKGLRHIHTSPEYCMRLSSIQAEVSKVKQFQKIIRYGRLFHASIYDDVSNGVRVTLWAQAEQL